MPIIVNLDVMMAKRKITLGELAERVGITQANLSILKNNKAKAVRFSTLENLCRVLCCQPQDLLAYEEETNIRPETERDYYESELTVKRAFWDPEGKSCYAHYLVHLLRNDSCYLPELTRVAEIDNRIVGLIMYAKAAIESAGENIPVLAMLVLCTEPGYRKKGIAERLLETTLAKAEKDGHTLVFVSEASAFLRKQDFVPAEEYGIKCETEVPLSVKQLVPDIIKLQRAVYIPPAVSMRAYTATAEAEEYDRKFPEMEKQKTEKRS